MIGNLGIVTAASALVVVAVLAATFFIGERLKRHNVVDVAWGLAFAGVSMVSAAVGTGDATRRWLLAALICVWGLRLAAYLGIRARGHGEDPRYEALLAKSKRTRLVAVVTRVYLLQGVLIWFISLPVQLSAALPQSLSWWAAAGVALWLLGFTFEAVGDAQLRAFKRRPENRGAVMTQGLWRYTRHPNYFGDFCLWWGLYLIALTGGPEILLTIGSPIVMSTLLIRVSGKSLLEQHMAGRPGYADYVRCTSGFIPRRPTC